MNTSFLITGATGNVGGAVLTHLQADSQASIYRATHHPNPKSPAERWLDFEQSNSFADALRGIDVVFLVRPPQLADVNRYFVPFIAACQQAAIKHIVFLSVQGVDSMSYIPHAKIEKLIGQSGLSYTFLRPSYFMENLTTTLLDDIVRQHRLFLPAGRAPFLWVDVDDIGRAGAVVLTNWMQHQKQAYTITGQDLLNFGQVSALLSAKLGFTVRYESPNPFRFYWVKRREGVGSGLILVMILLHFLPRFQRAPKISIDFTRLTGRTPTTLATFIEQHKATWQAGQA